MNSKVIIVLCVVVAFLFAMVGSCASDSEYETTEKTFSSWTKKDPNTWTDTQKEYFNDVMDWAAKN